MKQLLLSLLIFGFGISGSLGQTIKSLGFNTTNGQVVYSGTNQLNYTNSIGFNSIFSYGSKIGRPYLLAMQEIDALLVGKSTNQMSVFNTLNPTNTNYVRNTNIWANPIDLTGVAAYRSGSGTASIGTAVTPIHIIYAHHASLSNGTTFHFVDLENNVFIRTLTNSERVPSSGIDFTDIRVGVLNEPLPQSIKPLPIISLKAIENVRTTNGYINAFINQNQKLVVSRATGNDAGGVNAPNNIPNTNFWISPTNGDSGFPIFLIANGQAHLAAVFASVDGGEFLDGRRTNIQTVMSNLNSSYSLPPYFGRFVSPSTFMSVQSGDSLATVVNSYLAQPAREALYLRSESLEETMIDARDANDASELVFTNFQIATFAGNTASVVRDGLGFSTNLNTLWTSTNASDARSAVGLGSGITATNTFVSYNGTNYTTNTVTISNGIITGWTQ